MSSIKYKKKNYLEYIYSNINNLPTFENIEKHIFNLFHLKYCFSRYDFEKLIIDSIIFNQKIHIVAKFKENLVTNDLSEFLKRFYTTRESVSRLPLYFSYYLNYSKIFPNYTALNEAKYIYKNIHKKQKIIDMQQEEEFNNIKKEEEKKDIKHQRIKNKQEINTIFNNDIYNSIIKQSQDLYLLLFGINKIQKNKTNSNNNNDNNNEENLNSISFYNINNLVNAIDKYDYESKSRFNYKNNILIEKKSKNKNIKKNTKKENNSSILTKQSTFTSSNLYQKIKNFNKIYKNNGEIIIALRKTKKDIKNINSNSLLISNKKKKKPFVKGHFKSLLSGKLGINLKDYSKTKSKQNENFQQNTTKVNKNNFIDYKNNYLTDRSSINNKHSNIKKDYLFNNHNTSYNKIKSHILCKKLTYFNYKKIANINISNIHKHSRLNTNWNINNITETSKYKKQTKLSSRKKVEKRIIFNDKLKINIKKIRELIKKNKIADKFCFTERNSISPSHKNNNIIPKTKKQIIEKIKFKKINIHKKSVPSIEMRTKINKNILLSNEVMNNSKITQLTYKNNCLPLPYKERSKINKLKIKQICNTKSNSNSILDKIEDRQYYTERGSIRLESIKKNKIKIEPIMCKNFPVLQKIQFNYFSTVTNPKSKEKKKKNNNNSNNNNKYAKNTKKRKEISPPIKYNNILNKTEKNKKLVCFNKLLSKIK